MPNWLQKDVAVITGGASGIGREISCTLAEFGADVVVADLQQKPREGGRPTHELIREETDQQAEFVECDVSSLKDLETVFEVAEELGGVSILINNAGITEDREFLEESEETFYEIIDINVKGPFFASQFAARQMIETSDDNDINGRIVNIASISGIIGRSNGVVYSTSKGALRLMTYALAASLGSYGIRVNDVSPGLIDTSMSREDIDVFESESAGENAASRSINRPGKPQDIANAVLYLVSPLSDYVTAETLIVDGGTTNTNKPV